MGQLLTSAFLATTATEPKDYTLLLLVIIGVISLVAVLVLINIFLTLGNKFSINKEKKQLTAEEVADAVVKALFVDSEEETEEVAQEEIVEEEVEELSVEEFAKQVAEELVKLGFNSQIATQEEVQENEIAEADEEVEETFEDEEDEDDDESEEVAVSDENDPFAKLGRRPSKPFAQRLAEGDDILKANYQALKQEFESYKKVNARISKKCESFRFGRELVAKLAIRGKSIKCFLNLNPADFDEGRYHQKDASDKKSYVEVPLKMSVRSPRSLKRTIELIAETAKKLEIVKKA